MFAPALFSKKERRFDLERGGSGKLLPVVAPHAANIEVQFSITIVNEAVRGDPVRSVNR